MTTGATEISVRVPSAQMDVPVVAVRADEVWSFVAEGRWTDWFIGCGPNGYRNFLADMLSIRPRAGKHPWFCLIGTVDGRNPFRIGSGCTHRFTEAGRLSVYANDAEGRYGNNKGAVTLRASRGGVVPAPNASGGFAAAWRCVSELYEKTLGIPLAAILAVGAGSILAFTVQGRDLLRTAAEDKLFTPDASGWRLFAFAAGLLFLAIQVWFWSRTVIDSNYGLDRTTWRPKWLLEWGPRLLGFALFGLVVGALFSAADPSGWFITALSVIGLLFFAGVIWRQDALKRLRGMRGIAEDEPPWPFGRCWAILSFVLVIAALAAATVDPVGFGVTLGAPAVVFLGIGLIIPVMVTAVQLGAAMRLPATAVLLLLAVLFSLWMDNHEVGGRAFGPSAASVAVGPADRIDLVTAYRLWKAAQPKDPPGQPKRPMTMVLVASEGGASRAGFWTGEVLATLHQQSQGRFASSLFAINSVSGGSVGAVGYTTLLHDDPAIQPADVRPRLESITGHDALGPVMAGLLFPDLVQRFIPFAVLPDRAEAIERSWEAAWSESCAAPASCHDPDLMSQPFKQLGPSAGKPWTPLIIVQGASEETGRRILTSKLTFDPRDIDADDFYTLTGHDVPISTAIHNGARFPWISPAGTLTGPSRSLGHIVDGGYFDAAGVETIRELALAIDRIKDPGDELHFVYVFIGYNGATEDAQQAAVVDTPKSADAVPAAMPGPTSAPAAPAAQADTQAFLNETRAPLYAMLQSRGAHGAHLMRALKEAAVPPGSRDVDPFEPSTGPQADYVPIMLCDQYGPDQKTKTLELPLDWTLSQKAQTYMREATGFGATPGCGCLAGQAHCTRTAIEAVLHLIGVAP